MSLTVREPDKGMLRDLIEGLVGGDVAVRDASGEPAPDFVAIYCDDADQPRAVLVTDLAFAVATGCALGLLSAEAGKDAIAAGALEGVMRDSFYEVCNIFASLLCGDGHVHVRITKLDEGMGGVDAAALAIARSGRVVLECEVEIGAHAPGAARLRVG